MSEVPAPEEKSAIRRPRLLWTLLGAMVLVALLPLVISHYTLIGINRDSLETLEKKYLTRSAVGIATDIQNLLASNTQQLNEIAGSIRIMQKALPAGTDPFTYAANTPWIGDYVTSESDLLALRVLNAAGQGAEAKPAGLDAAVQQEMKVARQVALTGRPSIGDAPVSQRPQPAGGRHRRAGLGRHACDRHRRRSRQPQAASPTVSVKKARAMSPRSSSIATATC